MSLPKQFALISRAAVDASGKFSTFKQAVYMKALTAKKGKGGWDLLAPEIHSGRVLFRMEKHVDDTHGCTGRAGERLVERYDDRAVVFTEMNPIRLIKSGAVKAGKPSLGLSCSATGSPLPVCEKQVSIKMQHISCQGGIIYVKERKLPGSLKFSGEREVIDCTKIGKTAAILHRLDQDGDPGQCDSGED